MCLAIPVRIKEIEGSEAVVEIGGIQRKISLALTPEAELGHYVLVHAGYAIGVLDEKEAQETLKLFEEMAAFADKDDAARETNGSCPEGTLEP